MAALPAPAVVGAAFAVGSVPWTGLAARLVAGVDLRRYGSGTVSGTGLYEVAGMGPLVVAGALDMVCGAAGPLLAGRHRPRLGAVAAATTLCAHNWSPWLHGAGGRGVSTALGATAALAPEATALFAVGLAAGRLARQTGLFFRAAIAAVNPLLRRTRPGFGPVLGVGLTVPIVLKRLAGNRWPPSGPLPSALVRRLLFDRDG